MAATANASAPFGPPQTPSFAQSSPYLTDDLIKQELDVGDANSNLLASSPNHVTDNFLSGIQTAAAPEDFAAAPQPINSAIQVDMDSLRDGSMSVSGMHPASNTEDLSEDLSAQVANSIQADLESYAAEAVASVPNVEPMQAYAKLQFSDGDFYVSTQAVELGRDMGAMKYERRLKKQEKRRKEQEAAAAVAAQTPADGEAAAPTQTDKTDKAQIKRAVAMSGSNASENGGIIGNLLYSGSEDESKMSRRRRRKFLTSNDSSQSQSHSVAPASLHTNPNELSLTRGLFDSDFDASVPQPMDIPFVPIHPAVDRSITGISRKHIRIEYNGEKSHWELHVLGRNGAFVDDESFLEKGAVARLRHNSRIQVQGIDIVFKLPDNAREDEEVAVDSDGSDSDLSNLDSSDDEAVADDQESAASSDADDDAPKERVKLKLSLSKRGQALEQKTKKAAKLSLKASKNRPDKGAKTIPGASQPESTDVRPSIETDASPARPKAEVAGVPATPAPDLPPGSILAGLAPEEIPQKRKGPGRPPKNGVMSKRDEAIIKRKKKELQKAGREIPPLTELLAMARAEAGTTKKGEDGAEGDNATPNGGTTSVGAGGVDGAAASTDTSSKPQTAAEIEAAKARKQAKSPSPQKPESEYTEEELKKPQKTYVVLIHDALSASSTGIMDLQQIYDAIQKMYPYYKYRSQTQGWQSSIRHNLIGSEAFEEAGKIGKGRLWKINANYPIDKEKKRRAQTPPTDKPSYPVYQNGQYNNQGYPPYRPSPYGTPYGPPTNVPNGARPPPAYGQQGRGTYYSPYASNPAGQNHQSPYGAQSRPPYAHAPNQPANADGKPGGTPHPPNTNTPNGPTPNTAVKPPGAPQNSPHPQTPTPAGRGQPPPRPGSNPPAPGQAPQQGSIGSDDTIEEIMSYHKRYLGGFKPGVEQDAARDLFRKAVSRHIDHNKEHGEFMSDEEKKVADVIGEIIRRNRGKAKPPAPQARPSGTPGVPPQNAPHPPGSAGAPQRAPSHGAPTGQPHPGQAPNHAHPPGQGAAPPHNQLRQGLPPAQAANGSRAAPHQPAPQTQSQSPARSGASTPAATIDLTGTAQAAKQAPRPVGAPTPAVNTPAAAPANAGSAAVKPAAPVPAPAAAAPVPPATVPGPAPPAAGVKRSALEAESAPDAKKPKT